MGREAVLDEFVPLSFEEEYSLGTVARGRDLQEAFLITDLLAEAVRCRLVMPDETKTPA